MRNPSVLGLALLLANLSASAVVHAQGAAAPAPAATPAAPSAPAVPATADAVQPAMLNLGGFDVFSIHSGAGSMSPQDRVDQIDSRLNPLLGIPSIPPSAVRIYAPATGNPSIYVFGRRIVTVDSESAKAEGYKTPLELAKSWAIKLQEILPQVNYRAPGQPLPVIPAHPTVTVTDNLADVGGDMGQVYIGKKIVIRLRGVQANGMTAAERTDAIRTRLFRALRQPDPRLATNTTAPSTQAATPTATTPTTTAPASPAATTNVSATVTPDAAADSGPDITVQPVDSSATPKPNSPAELMVNGMGVISVDADLAKAADQPTPTALAQAWAKNIQAALTDNVTPIPTATPETSTDTAPTPAAPAATLPATPAVPAPKP